MERLAFPCVVRALVAALWLCSIAARAQPASAQICRGDCAGDGAVTVPDLVTGVNIALGNQPVSACFAMDGSGDGRVTIDELLAAVSAALGGCPGAPTATDTVSPTNTVAEAPTPTPSAPPATDTPTSVPTSPAHFCDLPGSVQTTQSGLVTVPGGPPGAPDLGFLHLPVGFCAHFFANVGNARQLRFAPGGELFVASPTTTTTGGGFSGRAAIVVLPDDDRDGTADSRDPFLTGLPSTQGMLFTDGYFYYQDSTRIMRIPYAAGDRVPSAAGEQVANITYYHSPLHWPKPMDVADDGTIYVGNGGDQGEPCIPPHPFTGGILKLDGTDNGSQVAKGFRNPIAIRCPRGHNLCYAIELTRDFTANKGGREKLVRIQQGDDWGFPCCATKDLPYPDITPVPDCSTIADDINSFIVGHTPFDLDFETGKWPAPWGHRVYVPLHGAYGTWEGARVVGIAVDQTTGEVLPGSELSGQTGALREFATGWDDGSLSHGRPANVAFAPDGRLFLGNDNDGNIIWIAPLDL